MKFLKKDGIVQKIPFPDDYAGKRTSIMYGLCANKPTEIVVPKTRDIIYNAAHKLCVANEFFSIKNLHESVDGVGVTKTTVKWHIRKMQGDKTVVKVPFPKDYAGDKVHKLYRLSKTEMKKSSPKIDNEIIIPIKTKKQPPSQDTSKTPKKDLSPTKKGPSKTLAPKSFEEAMKSPFNKKDSIITLSDAEISTSLINHVLSLRNENAELQLKVKEMTPFAGKFKEVSEEVAELQLSIASFADTIAPNMESKENEIKQLEGENADLHAEIQNISGEVRDLRTEVDSYKKLIAENKRLRSVSTAQARELQDLNKKVKMLETRVSAKRTTPPKDSSANKAKVHLSFPMDPKSAPPHSRNRRSRNWKKP